ncbi:MAG: phosphatase PAP2 family protein [Bacteroidota bacterium]
MKLLKKHNIPFNPYFFYPFLAWVVAGGVLLATFSKQQLFMAINSRHNEMTDMLMFQTTRMGEGEVILPVLLLVMAFAAYRNWWYLITALTCGLVPLGLQHMFKQIFDAPRPMSYFHKAEWIHILPGWPVLMSYSFPSGHTEGAFSFFCFLSLLLPPSSQRFGLLFCLLALSVGYSRIYLAAHFFADIYFGSIIGTVVTMLVFALMTRLKGYFIKEKGTFA